MHAAGRESDAIDLVFGRGIIIATLFLANNNDPIGIINKVYSVSNSDLMIPKDITSIAHPESSNTAGDYKLRFHIKELVRKISGRNACKMTMLINFYSSPGKSKTL